ncbi:MAG TPA: FAD/NAD(P)-binding oxidoreductase [Isosphaeraceae bacterium]|nr:FAD/NAD(P)-binding oxidoreductase [Isosphaeraceae bacterium]
MSGENGRPKRVVIVGGGTAGITVAARLCRKLPARSVMVIDPSRKHYYQPLWTLVGAGVMPKQVTERQEADFMPPDSRWLQDGVETFLPEENAVVTRSGQRVDYDFLVVAAGIQCDWDKVTGLVENLGQHGVCSNYSYHSVDYTWTCIRQFQGGRAIFTMPATAVKCGGAPQKIMYLADDAFRRQRVRDKAEIVFTSGISRLFAVEKYRNTLEKVVERKGLITKFMHDLVEIRTEPKKEAVFKNLNDGSLVTLDFEMIHVTPPMSAPDFIKRSPLANETGWVDADRQTLQHPRYPNVFALGDSSGLPTSKTGAAIRKQAPVVERNLLAAMEGRPLKAIYDGYTSCPLVTGYGKMVLAEFDYEHRPRETFPFDQSKERLSMYLLKKYGLPAMYWHGMLKGKM